jgi:hypothetical protein
MKPMFQIVETQLPLPKIAAGLFALVLSAYGLIGKYSWEELQKAKDKTDANEKAIIRIELSLIGMESKLDTVLKRMERGEEDEKLDRLLRLMERRLRSEPLPPRTEP